MIDKKNVSNLLTLAFLAVFIWYWYKNPNIFSPLGEVSALAIILIALGRSCFHVANGLFAKWTTESFTPGKLTIGEGYYIGVLTAIGNFFGPVLGGASIRAVYLKKVHKLPYSKFTATMVGYYLILFSMACVLAIVSLLALPPSRQTTPLIIAFGVWIVVMLALRFLRLPQKEKMGFATKNRYSAKLVDIIYEIEDGWHLIINNHRLVTKLIFLAFFILLINLGITLVEFGAIGVSISLAAATLYSVLSIVAILVSFTPGAIGIRETMLIVVSSTLGVTNEEILQVAIIDRAVTFGLLLVLFAITRSGWLKRRLTSKDIQI